MPDRDELAQQIGLAPADAGQPVHLGQQPGLLEGSERHGHGVAAALRGRGDSLVRGEAAAATVGVVEVP